jgi:hypothetical protein
VDSIGATVLVTLLQSPVLDSNVVLRRILMLDRLTTKALIGLACSLLLVLTVSTAWAQERVLEGAKKGVETAVDKTEDVGEAVGKGVKKGAEEAIDKTEDVGEAVGKGVKDVFTDDDPDSDNDEGIAADAQATEPQQQSSPGVRSSAATESDTENRELPATAGEQPLILLIGMLALATAVALKVFRRVPNS